MYKFPISSYKRYAELPLNELDSQRFAIYIIDFNWNYLFVNTFACQTINKSKDDLIGKSLFAGVELDPEYSLFLKKVEQGLVSNIITISPVTKKRVSVTGYPLEDCYYFAVSMLPDKQDLMNELRSELGKQVKK